MLDTFPKAWVSSLGHAFKSPVWVPLTTLTQGQGKVLSFYASAPLSRWLPLRWLWRWRGSQQARFLLMCCSCLNLTFFLLSVAFIKVVGGRSESAFWIRNADRIPEGLLQWWELTGRRTIKYHLHEIPHCNTISRTHTPQPACVQTGTADLLESAGHFVYDNQERKNEPLFQGVHPKMMTQEILLAGKPREFS